MGLCSFGLHASSLAGTFSLTGDVTVTGNTITWSVLEGTTVVDNQAQISDATGAFASLNGDYVTIANLANPPETVGVQFTDTAFITLPDNMGSLDINYIEPGTDGSGGCSDAPPAAGQECTPTITQGGSTVPGPFNMQNTNPCPSTNPNCGLPLGTAISWTFSGDALSGRLFRGCGRGSSPLNTRAVHTRTSWRTWRAVARS